SCTSPSWTSVSGKKLGASVQTSLNFDKDTDTYYCSFLYIGEYELSGAGSFTAVISTNGEDCLQKCVDSKSCTSPSWTSVSGKKLGASVQTSLNFDKDTDTYYCSFLYIGEYELSGAGSFTAVISTNGEDCLQKCVDSSECQVASYLKKYLSTFTN
ncbi:hypothetical protein LSH36_3580g00005, partial [Paralvinella palmiformis]